MKKTHTDKSARGQIVATAKAFGTAIVSLAMGVAICLCLMLGGGAVAAGAANPAHQPDDRAPITAAMPAEHSLEGVMVVLEKLTERATEPHGHDAPSPSRRLNQGANSPG
jgi:hypothetical protein